MNMGDEVLVKLWGDETIYHGKVLNPRKQWVQLFDYHSTFLSSRTPFIADENSIEHWNYQDQRETP